MAEKKDEAKEPKKDAEAKPQRGESSKPKAKPEDVAEAAPEQVPVRKLVILTDGTNVKIEHDETTTLEKREIGRQLIRL